MPTRSAIKSVMSSVLLGTKNWLNSSINAKPKTTNEPIYILHEAIESVLSLNAKFVPSAKTPNKHKCPNLSPYGILAIKSKNTLGWPVLAK